MSHTPGPWDWKFCFQCAVGPESDPEGPESDPEGNAVAVIIGHPAEVFANARLISAAPDLLEACESLFDAMGEPLAFLPAVQFELLRAAISKATGSEAQHG